MTWSWDSSLFTFDSGSFTFDALAPPRSNLTRIIFDSDTTPPTVPASLVGSAFSATRIDWSWQSSIDGGSGLAGYDLVLDNGVVIALGVQLTYSQTGLTAGTSHTGKIRARDAAGNVSAYTSTVSQTTQSSGTFAFNLTGQFDTIAFDSMRPATPRFYLCNNQWAGASGFTSAYLRGNSERSWQNFNPYAFNGNQVNNYPSIIWGWKTNFDPGTAGTFPFNGGKVAPQISSLTSVNVRCANRAPINRSAYGGWGLFDTYAHNKANPLGTDTPIASIMVMPSYVDTATYIAGLLGTYNVNSPGYGVGSKGSDTWSFRTVIGGKDAIVVLRTEGWAVNPGAGKYNTARIFYGPWNDLQHGGCKFTDYDHLALLKDLAANASAWGFSLTTAHFLTSIQFGFENTAGGPATPTDQRFNYIDDFQLEVNGDFPIQRSIMQVVSENISRGKPTYSPNATIFDSSQANTASYNNWFRTNGAASSGNPNIWAIDLSSVPQAKRRNLLWFWTGENGGGGNTGFDQGAGRGQNLIGSYTIEGNTAAFTGEEAPSTGWVVLSTTVGNVYNGRVHDLDRDYGGDTSVFQSFRKCITAGSSINSNNDSSFHVDICYAPTVNGRRDFHLLTGDSHTEKYLKLADTEAGGAAPAANNNISLYTQPNHCPVIHNMANSGWALTGSNPNYEPTINHLNGVTASWLDDCPDNGVLYDSTGYNDIPAGITQTQYQTAFRSYLDIGRSHGHLIYVSLIVYELSSSGGNSTTVSNWRKQVLAETKYASDPMIKIAMDWNTICGNFKANWFVPAKDPIHLWAYGQAGFRGTWSDWMGRNHYLGFDPAIWVPDYTVGTGVGGH